MVFPSDKGVKPCLRETSGFTSVFLVELATKVVSGNRSDPVVVAENSPTGPLEVEPIKLSSWGTFQRSSINLGFNPDF